MNATNAFVRAVAAIGAGLAGFVALPAHAVLVDSRGDSFIIDFYGNGGALNATAQFTVTGWSVNTYISDYVGFNVGVTNNSPGANSRLTALSILDLSPTLTGALAGGGWDAIRNVNAGGGYNPVDLCIYDGVNCNGGTNQGVAGNGGFESFNLYLFFSALTNAGLTLDGFVGKFQTDNGSFHIAGCVRGTDGCGGTSVPEPGTLGLMGLTLLGVGLARRRMRPQAT